MNRPLVLCLLASAFFSRNSMMSRVRKILRQVAATLMAMFFVGEAAIADTQRIFQGKQGFVLAGPESLVNDSRVLYLEMLKDLHRADKLDADQKQVKRSAAIATQLVAVASNLYPSSADWKWELHVATDKSPNAFCMPGGKMLINSSLLEHFAKDNAAIAAVLGHEIAHALLEHGRSKMDKALLQNGVQWMLTRSFRVGSVGVSSLGFGEKLGRSLPMSRQAEMDADTLGMEIAVRAGYEPTGAIRVFEYFASLDKTKGGSDFLDTHPLDARRIANIERMLPLLEAMKRVEGRQ